jgi:hypothetical protein
LGLSGSIATPPIERLPAAANEPEKSDQLSPPFVLR